jgi:hypothetical protein
MYGRRREELVRAVFAFRHLAGIRQALAREIEDGISLGLHDRPPPARSQ